MSKFVDYSRPLSCNVCPRTETQACATCALPVCNQHSRRFHGQIMCIFPCILDALTVKQKESK